MALSNDGLFKKTQQVAQKSTEAMMKEEVALLFTEWEADYYETGVEVSGRSGDTMSGAFVEYDGKTLIYEKDGRTYEMPMSANGDVGEIKEVEPDKNSQSYKARHPEDHIPAGFHHTIGTVSTGYVIADEDGNEFVWIPVDGNRIKYERKLGQYNFCLKENDGVESLSDISEGIQGDILGTFENNGKLAQELTNESVSNELKEAKIINNAGGFWVGRYEAGIDTKDERKKSVIGDDSDSSNSNYEDFDTYWEKNKKEIVVKSGMEPVRMITQNKALAIANSWKASDENQETGTKFQSGLITGAEWDIMCEFIGWNICNTGNQTWGNCWNVLGEDNYSGFHSSKPGSNWIKNNNGEQKPASREQGGTCATDRNTYWVFPTGLFKNSIGVGSDKKNIFDVLGNVGEYTTEVCLNNENSVVRSSSASVTNSTDMALARNGSLKQPNGWATTGFRIVLYVE